MEQCCLFAYFCLLLPLPCPPAPPPPPTRPTTVLATLTPPRNRRLRLQRHWQQRTTKNATTTSPFLCPRVRKPYSGLGFNTRRVYVGVQYLGKTLTTTQSLQWLRRTNSGELLLLGTDDTLMEHHEKVLALQMHMCEEFQLAFHVRVLRFYGGLGVKVLRVGLKFKD